MKILLAKNKSISHYIVVLHILPSCRDRSSRRWSSNNIYGAIDGQKRDFEALRSMQVWQRETKRYHEKYLSPSVPLILYWQCWMQRNSLLGRKKESPWIQRSSKADLLHSWRWRRVSVISLHHKKYEIGSMLSIRFVTKFINKHHD